MGNKHGTLSLGRCRDKHRPDTRSKHWSFHSMDSRRVGSSSRSHASSSVSIHTSGGQSFVKYQARGGSATRLVGAAAASNREEDVDACSRAGLVVRSLSAPAQDVGKDYSLPETHNSTCISRLSKKPVCLAESDSTIHKIPLTPTADVLPVDLEHYQQHLESPGTALEDPWVRRSRMFETSTDSTTQGARREPSCRRKLFDSITTESCKDGAADSASLDSLDKRNTRITFSKNRRKNNPVLKTKEEEKCVISRTEGTDKTADDASSRRVHALSYLSKIWNERLKSSSNRLRSKSREDRTCESQSEVTRPKSTKESGPAYTLSSGRSDKTSSGEPQIFPPPGERVAHFLTNQKGLTGLFAKKKILNKNSVQNARLYKSNETIINKSTEAIIKKTNTCFETQVNRDLLPISTSEILIATSDCAVPLVTKNKHRNVSSSSADGLQYSEIRGSKPPRNPFHRGSVSPGTSSSASSLHSEPHNARRIRRRLGVNSSALDSQTQDEPCRRIPQRSRRSLQCFSLNLDTFTEEFLGAKPASHLDLVLDQITNTTSSTRDINTDRHSGNLTIQSNVLINDAQTTNTYKSNTDFTPCGDKSTQAEIKPEIGKLNSTRCKLNLPVGRNMPGKHGDKKPFHFSNSHTADSNLSFATPNLTTTPTTTDSGYNTESSFSCEKTPRIAKVFDSPISEILYFNVDEEDLEETFSFVRCGPDNTENNCMNDGGRCKSAVCGPNVDNLKATAGVEATSDAHVCDDQNVDPGTSGNEYLNGKHISLLGDRIVTTQKETNLTQDEETNDAQENTHLANQETDKNSTRQEEMDVRRQEEMNCTVNLNKSLPIPENTEKTLYGLQNSEICHRYDDSCSNHISTTDTLPSRRLNQEKQRENRNRKERREHNSTHSSTAQSHVCAIRHFATCNTGSSCGRAVSLTDLVAHNNEGHTFDECISSHFEVSQVKMQNAKEGTTEIANEEDLSYVSENSNEMFPLIFAPITDDSRICDDKDLCNNGDKTGLFTARDYCSNAAENSPPNGTRQDRETVFSSPNSERKGGNVVTEEYDQSTKDKSTYVCCSSRGGNSRVCSGEGGVGNIPRQTSRDTDQQKVLSSGLFSRSLGNRDNCSGFSKVTCDLPVPLNVSFLSEQLQNKTTGCDFKEDRDITAAKSTAQTELLGILDSTPRNHCDSQTADENLEFTKDISPPMVCAEASISTNSLTCEIADIVDSGYLKWRCSTPCSREQTSSVCLENLARCIEGICRASSQQEQTLEGSCSRTSTTESSTKDFSNFDHFIGNRNQEDDSARFFKEPSQPDDCGATVKQVDQNRISHTYVDKLRQCHISGSCTENANQPISFGTLADTLNQPVILGLFTETLSQSNNYNTCIANLIQDESRETSSRDNLTQPDCCNAVVEQSNQTTTSDAPKNRPRHLHRALSVSDSNLPNALFKQALKPAAAKKPPKPRKRLAFGSTEVHEKNESSPSDGHLLHPLKEMNSHNAHSTKNYMASDCSLYFSDNTKNRGLRSDACGSQEMLNSYHYNDNVDCNANGSYGKKVASCSNLTDHRSKYRSRIAMGLTSVRMRSCAGPAGHPCTNPSLRLTHSASPMGSNIRPENSITSKITACYRNPRQACLMGNSQNWKSVINTEVHKQDLSTPNTFVKHSRSLDMCVDKESSAVHACGHAQSRHVSETEDQQPGRFDTSGERRSSDSGQRYLSEPDDLSCFARHQQDLLPLKAPRNDFYALASSSFEIAGIISTAKVVYTSPSCLNKLNQDSCGPHKNLQIVYGKDSTKCVNSLDSVLSQECTNRSYSGGSLPTIDSDSNNTPAELNIRAASESSGVTNSQCPSLQLQDNCNFNIDPNSEAMSTDYRTSPVLMESSGLRHSHMDRVWSYSMTSLLEGSSSADLVCVEADPVMDTPAAEVCPTCHRPFDSGKKRRLIDSCGHERCYTCMFNSEICSVCVRQGYPLSATLTHCLTDSTAWTSDPPEIPPRGRVPAASPGVLGPPPLPAKAKHSPQQGPSHQRRKQSPVHYSNQPLTGSSLVGCKSPVTMETLDLDRESDSPPPPPPDVAQHDLMMRLGLLLGDPIHPSGITGVGVVLPGHQQGEETLRSVSSLSSNEHTPEKFALDGSPMSTLTASTLGTQEDIPMFGSKRNASVRRSAQVSVNGRRSEPRATKSDQLPLKPLVFEVPHPEGKPIFVGRAWLFNKLEAVFGAGGFGASKSNGVIITGAQGTGKTAIVEQLINHSCFSEDHTGCSSARSQDKHQTNQSHSTKLTDYTALNGLGFQVVAYHVCQADSSATCMVADMVSSMAAQMAKAPQLVAYRELLLQEPHLQSILSITECTQNPSLSFLKGILEPLQMLKAGGKIFTDCCIILVDSLNEAEFHKPDHGDTIASFLCRHASKFPDWLKLVVTVQSSFQEITSSLQFSRISLDQHGGNSDHVSRDIVSYIEHRISISSAVRANIAVNGRPNKELTAKFTSHVKNLSNGSFLYAKLVLDLIENGCLIPKSSSYTILPVNLSEVFLLHFNLKFSSIRAFERVSAILAVCLASLYPLTLVDIFLTVNSGYVHQYLSWEDFSQRMDVLAGFVYSCHDNTVKFFHPAFREWLIHRNEGDSPKFICDLRHGHALMAFRLSRVSAPLSPDKTIELGHHILKAHIYKSVSRQLGFSSQNVQAYWMCLSSHSLNAALVSHRNVYSPNVKVSRLILLSGGNPNSRTEYLNNAPILCVAAREGYIDMLSLLLEFGADPNVTSDTGMTPLCHGSAGGHVEVMRMLCLHNARPSAQDAQGHSAAIHAVIHGQLEAIKFLMHLNWTVHPKEPAKDEVITQCFVAAAAIGNTQILDYLHQTYNGSRLNMVDSLLSETALTAACLHGRTLCVRFLLDSRADIRVSNARFLTPLLCAVKGGCWEVCDLLLASGADLEMTDQYGCTPLMMAAREGHTAVLTFLLDKGASQVSTDQQGLTALCWACLQGHLSVVESLVARGSDVNHSDVRGRCPLHLAAMYGDINVIQFLIDHKAYIEQTDLNGMRALDFAIVYNNMAVIICFLRKGAKLGPNTWNLAAEKTDILMLLLNKLIEDGSILYKKNRIKEASQRYQYALKKLPTDVRPEEVQMFQELKLSFLLNLSRCKRRMNDLQSAIDLATKALEVRPKCFEAYYARARARRDNRQYAGAQQDLVEALQLAPKNRELQRLLTRVKEECWQQMARYESGGGREAVNLEMDRIVEDDNDSLIVDNPVLYLPTV